MGVIDFSTKKYLFINMRFHKYTVANYIVFSQVNGLGIIMSKFVNYKFPTFRCFEELLLQQNVKKFCDKWQFCPLLTITNRSFCELCLNLKDKRQSRLFFSIGIQIEIFWRILQKVVRPSALGHEKLILFRLPVRKVI